MFTIKEKIIDLGDGRTITLETGRMARQADGSVLLKMGKTMLLATVVSAQEAKADTDFMPLSVEYKEKYASSGRFPGGFMKREARASDYEILVSRLVDRVLRPLFPDDYHAETFVTINFLFILATRTSDIGPLNGMSDTARAADAASPARASGIISISAETRLIVTKVSA
jgi:polyribonucleotide nucleotidyltransferase